MISVTYRGGHTVLSSDAIVIHRDVDQTTFDCRRFSEISYFSCELIRLVEKAVTFSIYFLEVKGVVPI